MSLFKDFQRHEIPVGGDVVIHAVEAGRGPGLLLLHGFPQNLAMWAKVAPQLTGDFHVVCADLRGYGDSSKPAALPDAANYSFRAMAADQLEVMRQLGHEQFHVVGHDRGGRTAHRMALDHPERVLSVAVLDIVPTYDMFMQVNHLVARAYWHWYFLQNPAPFLEAVIGAAPDTFYEHCLASWGATQLDAFDGAMLDEYRRCWRTREFIRGSSSDYRAAATVDLELDAQDLRRKVECPALALWGTQGHMHRLFDLQSLWKARCSHLRTETLPAGHFLVDQMPAETVDAIRRFLR
jgi:haloacetate dehalogenase